MVAPHRTRSLRLAAAAALGLAGVAMLVLPGPGLLTLLGAAHLVVDDVPGLRTAMERWLPSRLVPAGYSASGQVIETSGASGSVAST